MTHLMTGEDIMGAIKLLTTEKGVSIPPWKKHARNALRIVLVAMVWIGHIWIFLWLKREA